MDAVERLRQLFWKIEHAFRETGVIDEQLLQEAEQKLKDAQDMHPVEARGFKNWLAELKNKKQP